MPKPTLFSVSINGQDRLLFSVQERASGDLTLVMKHSLFHVTSEGNTPVVEERISVHRSPQSASVHAIKYTKVLQGGRAQFTRNYSEAMKLRDLFCGIFIRRAGNLTSARYTFPPTKGTVISLGPYDPQYFQPTIFALISLRNRVFKRDYVGFPEVNVLQVPLGHFSITVLWQFLTLAGLGTSQNLIARTFKQEEIDAAPPLFRESMAAMAHGVDERGAYAVFASLKREMALAFLDAAWERTTAREKREHKDRYDVMKEIDAYLPIGTAFSQEHRDLLFAMQALIALRRSGL